MSLSSVTFMLDWEGFEYLDLFSQMVAFARV
jgi:hypothetical protein